MNGLPGIKPTAPAKDAGASTEAPAESTAESSVSYSSHPIENYALGRFVFNKGLLVVTGDDVEIFERLHAQLPPMEQHRIKKLDVEAADRFVRERMANAAPAATQAFDSSIGERARPVIGTGKLEDSNPADGAE